MCSIYECESEIRDNKHVHFAPLIGGDNDAQYRYGHNVKALSKKIDTTNLKTYIEGSGANNLFVSYTSPLASNPKNGIRKSDPVRDDRFTQSESMIEHLKRELNDVIEAYFELYSVELTNKELGERVWFIYEPLGIEFQTRILRQTKTRRKGKLVTSKVILGNTLPKSPSDILASQKVEIDENRKEYRSSFEQTNELIHLSVTDLSGRMGHAESSINNQANQIQQKVSIYDFNGQNVSSLITQDPYAISMLAQNLNLQGLVTVTNLKTPGQTIIDGGNVYGSSFQVGRGTGSRLTMTAIAGSHIIQSNDVAGFRIGSNGSMRLSASGQYGVYIPNSVLDSQRGLRVSGGITDIQVPMTVQSTLNASVMQIKGLAVTTQTWVANMNYVLPSTLNQRIAQLETDIKTCANGKSVAK